jgi:hypothetical protein
MGVNLPVLYREHGFERVKEMKKIQKNMLHESFQKIRHFLKRDADTVSQETIEKQDARKPLMQPAPLFKRTDERKNAPDNYRKASAVGYMEEDSTFYGPKAFRTDTYAS